MDWGDVYVRIRPLSVHQRTSGDVAADTALLNRVVARDANALAELYDKYGRLLFGLILRILKNRDEAEDVLQEVFVQAWTRAGSYHSTLGSPAGWLVGVSRNRAIDRLRANAVRLRTVETAPIDSPAENPESGAVLGEQQLDVQRALDALPPEQQTLIRHAYYFGFTHSELADRFNLPLGTVKTRIRSGMLALRGRLERRLIEQ